MDASETHGGHGGGKWGRVVQMDPNAADVWVQCFVCDQVLSGETEFDAFVACREHAEKSHVADPDFG